jgi:hypothetical protein
MLGQVVLVVAILAVLQFAPSEYLPCSRPLGDSYPTPVPAAGGVAVGVWLLATALSLLLFRGFRRRLVIRTPAGRSRNYPACAGLACAISLFVLATLCAFVAAVMAFLHPPTGLGCYIF